MASEKEASTSVLTVSITRGLMDKLVERRKGAALELERMVKDMVMLNEFSQIKQVVYVLENDFTQSSNPNTRKGGLVGLAATAIALGKASIGMHLPELVQPVLACFDDQDARVRYYACESLYNISKVARAPVLVFFNEIFEGLCKLSSDSDSNVRYGAELLDRLMKDVVSENPHFDIDNFILLLRSRIYTQDHYARQFLVSWISFLDSVPDIHMHEHIPEFIDGLFCILGDKRKDIKKQAQDTLGELLKEIQEHNGAVRFEAMTTILAIHSQIGGGTEIQSTALVWLKVFLDLGNRCLMGFVSNILVSILPCMSLDGEIHNKAVAVNDRMKKLILPEDDEDTTTDLEPLDVATHEISSALELPPLQGAGGGEPGVQKGSGSTNHTPNSSPVLPRKQLRASPLAKRKEQLEALRGLGGGKGGGKNPRLYLLAVLGVLIDHMKYTHEETRLEALRWVIWLHEQVPRRIYRQAGTFFPVMLELITDPSDKVLRMVLHVIALLSTSKASPEVEAEATPPAIQVGGAGAKQGKKERGTSVQSDTHSTAAPNSKEAAKSSKAAKLGSDASKSQPPPPVAPLTTKKLNKYFKLFLEELLQLFNKNRTLLENKGAIIIRQLCVDVDAHSVYCILAEILNSEEDLNFASLMVQVLNMILFTSMELHQLRTELKNLSSPESWLLFTKLYHCWCHNPVATLGLCLLTQNYEHASKLVQHFTNLEITASFLKELDKLVQLVESPIFTFLRLQLMDPHGSIHLIQTLYGVLMVLPQSGAFGMLKQRLSCVPVITSLPHDKHLTRTRGIPRTVNFEELLKHFLSVQEVHSAAKKKRTTQLYRTDLSSPTNR